MAQSSLDTLINLATDQRDAAAVTLGQLRGKLTQSQQQHDALLAYRDEYRRRMEAAMAEGLSMARLDNYRRFLASLEAAIEQQEKTVDHGERRVVDGKHQWQNRQQRLKSYDTLATRRRDAAARREAKREQQITDEAAGRARGLSRKH